MRLKNVLNIFFLSALTLAGSARAADNAVAAQYHFAGLETLTANPDLVTLQKFFALTNGPKFHDVIINSLSELLPKELGLNQTETNSALLHPILDDLGRAESAGGFGGDLKDPLGFVLAVKLAPARAELWKKNLTEILPGKAAKITLEGYEGLSWGQDTGGYQVIPADGWLIVSRGTSLLPLQTTYLQAARKEHRAVAAMNTNCFEADVDWVRMAPFLSLTNCPLKMARTIVSMAASGDDMRTTARIIYPDTIPDKFETWKFPTNTVSDPMISFTAARNVASLLNISPLYAPFVSGPFSHQVFVWALNEMVLQTYAAAPVNEPTNLMQAVYSNLPAAFNPLLKERREGEISWATNRLEVSWSGLGMLAPYLRPLHDKSGAFLVAGLFPLPYKNKPAPPELWKEIEGIDHLVYYDWEMTSERMQQWRLLSQMLPVLPATSRPLRSRIIPGKTNLVAGKTNSPAGLKPREPHPSIIRENWLNELGGLLGESVTQVTLTGPNELSLLRKSQTGLTGFELILFTHWLSGTGTGPFNRQMLPPAAKTSMGPPGP